MLVKTKDGRTIDSEKVRLEHGIGSLLGYSTKVAKTDALEPTTTAILYLSPGAWLFRHLADEGMRELIGEELCKRFESEYKGGIKTLCPMAGGCEANCLAEGAGLMKMKRNAAVRARRTMLLLLDRAAFGALLRVELREFAARAARAGLEPVVRLNGGSDVDFDYLFSWLAELLEELGIRRYEYTKRSDLLRKNPGNIDYTFSRDASDAHPMEALENGVRISAVFDLPTQIKRNGQIVRAAGELPATWNGFPVVDGDTTDARWLDPQGVVVGLRLKGSNSERQQAIDSGFAIAAS